MKAPEPVVAAIDIGSNTIKLTVAQLRQGLPLVLASKAEFVRLSEGLALTGTIRPDRFGHGIDVISDFGERARRLGATRIEAVATEATRAASNGPEFLARLREVAGIDVLVITGAEEAALTARGVLAQIDSDGRVLIVDIGGGSTELIETRDGDILESVSIPIGSGRMTDLHVAADPPTSAELDIISDATGDAVRAYFAAALRGGKLVIVGGVGEYLMRVSESGNPMPISALRRARDRSLALPAEDLALVAEAPAARARVLPAGFAIAGVVTELAQVDSIQWVANGLRMGLLLRMAEGIAVND